MRTATHPTAGVGRYVCPGVLVCKAQVRRRFIARRLDP
jgi:hypothetical protein